MVLCNRSQDRPFDALPVRRPARSTPCPFDALPSFGGDKGISPNRFAHHSTFPQRELLTADSNKIAATSFFATSMVEVDQDGRWQCTIGDQLHRLGRTKPTLAPLT